MAQIGDIVRYLNSTGGGKIVKIVDNIAYVDEDGFETPVLLRECVVVTPAKPASPGPSKLAAAPRQAAAPAPQPKSADLSGGKAPAAAAADDKLDIVLAFEAENLRQLGSTAYNAYLVNDSSYRLMATVMTRADGEQWVTRFAGEVEAGYQEHLWRIEPSEVGAIDRVCVQYVAYKPEGEFRLKAPVAVEYNVDNVKFFKLHSFRPNVYFDNPVLAFDIVKADIPQRQMVIDAGYVERAMTSRPVVKSRPVERRQPQQPKAKRPEVIEVDLHINELLDSTAGLDNADMLAVQLKEFNRVMEENLRYHGQKIVFIHGKGEGVLRQALLKELKRRYSRCDVQDASFREYGFGATQVTIR